MFLFLFALIAYLVNEVRIINATLSELQDKQSRFTKEVTEYVCDIDKSFQILSSRVSSVQAHINPRIH